MIKSPPVRAGCKSSAMMLLYFPRRSPLAPIYAGLSCLFWRADGAEGCGSFGCVHVLFPRELDIIQINEQAILI